MPEENLNTEVQATNAEVVETVVETPVTSPVTSPSPVSSDCADTNCKRRNALGVIALIIAIVGLLLTITLFGSIVGIPLLLLALLLGIIALFWSPRGSAIASVIISIIPLGIIACVGFWLVSIFAPIFTNFASRAETEFSNNPMYKEVASQPGFDDFFQSRLEIRLKSIDWQAIQANAPKGKDAMAQYYVNYALNEVRAEFPLAIDAWIALYGLPEGAQGMLGTDTITPPANTTRILTDFDGVPVEGTYTLSFDTTSLSAKFCNTLNGEYSITADTINVPMLIQTAMFCLEDEPNMLEAAFKPDGANFTIASTRMVNNNLERLALVTLEGHIFLYTNVGVPEVP